MPSDGKSEIPCEKCNHPQTRVIWVRTIGALKTYRLVCTNQNCRHNFDAHCGGPSEYRQQ